MDSAQIQKLRPSARHKFVAQLAQEKSQSSAKTESLPPVDYGVYLIHSLDLKAIAAALTHPYPRTRCLAIKAFHKAWLQLPPAETVAAIGGAMGLAELLSNVSFQNAKSLSEKLGHDYRGPDDPRTASCVLDELVSLLVPSIGSQGPNHPISRLGSTLATMYLPAVSPAIILKLFQFVSEKDANRLRRLLHTQPGYIGNFLQADYDTLSNPAVRWKNEELIRLFSMRSVREVPDQADGHWGITLFIKLMAARPPSMLNFRPDIFNLVTIGAMVLQNAPNDDAWTSVMEALLGRLAAGSIPGRVADFSTWKKVILSNTDKMSRISRTSIAKEALKKYLQRIGGLVPSGINAGIINLLPQLPLSIRQDVLRSLHNMNDDREWAFPDDATRIDVSTVMRLNSAQGKPILRRMEPHFANHSLFSWYHTSLTRQLANILRDLDSQPADRDDAISTAVEGRWAYLEGDIDEQNKAIQAVERWKKLVHRQRQAEGRLQYTRTLFTIVATIGDIKLLKETFAWAFERFHKDVDVRPTFQSHISTCVSLIAGHADNLENTAREGDELIGLLIDTMSKARTEPAFRPYDFTQTVSLCQQILWARMTLCQRHSIPLSRAEAVINPLKGLLLHTETIQLEDPGTFGKPAPYPKLYSNAWPSSTIQLFPVYKQIYRQVFVRFIDDLSRVRDVIYADKRAALAMELDRTDQNSANTLFDREPWPYRVTADTFKGLSLEKDAPFLYDFIYNVVYTPVNTVDQQDACRGQWAYAIDLYSECANTAIDRDVALEPVVQHYRTKAVLENGDQVDLSTHLLTVDGFMKAVQKSELLMEQFFLPYSVGFTNEDPPKVFFGTPDPSGVVYSKDTNLSLFRGRRGPVSLTDLMRELSSINLRKGTHHLRRQIAVISVLLWMHALRGLETVDKGYSVLTSDDPALDFAAMYNHTVLPERQNDSISELDGYTRTLISGIDQFTTEELKNVVTTVKSLISRVENQPHRDKALRSLAVGILPHSHVPTLLEADIFEVLADKELSSLHRNFFNEALLTAILPVESNRLTRRFFTLVSEEMSKKPEPKPQGTTKAQDTAKPQEPEASVKVSTIKFLVTFVAQPYTGLSLDDMARELESIARQQSHPSVQEAVLSMLISIIVREGRLRPQSQLEPIWKLLEAQAAVACSLDEKRQLTEKDWSRPKLPEIILNNERPALFLNVQINTIPAKDRSRWTMIVEGMLAQQVSQTKRWMGEFLRRHHVKTDYLELVDKAEFGALLPCLSLGLPASYTKLLPYLPKNSWHLRILEFQISSYLIANKLQVVPNLLETLEPEWRKTQDGKDFQGLLGYWGTGRLTAFRTLVSTLQTHGYEEVRQSLQVALGEHLASSAMLVSVGSHLTRTPPWEALIDLIRDLRPPQWIGKSDQDNWKNNIRPLVQWLDERVERDSKEDEQTEPYYMELLSHIKSLLLPFPFLNPGDVDVYANFATELYSQAFTALHQPPALQCLNMFLTKVLPPLIGFAGDYVAVVKCLIEEADQAEEDECLLGYRLAQSFADWNGFNFDQREEMNGIMARMETHPNTFVRLLALSRSRTLSTPEDAPYYSMRGSGRGLRRGAGRGRVVRRGQGRGRGGWIQPPIMEEV